jgi:signal transduction histidine kinase
MHWRRPVSRITGGRQRLRVAEIEITALVREALEAIRPSADAKRITMAVQLPPSMPRITVDPGRLQQVIWNLLTNAIKFTPGGGTVTVSAAPTPDGMELTVRDSGRGIAPEFLPFVFDPFRQAESGTTRTAPGLGLGLAIVHRIVEAHGGRVEAASDGPGYGATFRVYLPAVSSATGLAGHERRAAAGGTR